MFFPLFFSCSSNVTKQSNKEEYYQVDAYELGGNIYNDVNDIIKIKGDSFYHLHTVSFYKRAKARFETAKNYLLLIDKGVFKRASNGVYEFVSDKAPVPPTFEYEVVQNGSQFTKILSRAVTKYDLKDSVSYENDKTTDNRSYSLMPSNYDSIRSIDIINKVMINGASSENKEVSDTIYLLQTKSIIKCGGRVIAYSIPNLSGKDNLSNEELEAEVLAWYPILLTNPLDCYIPPGSDVKITIYIDTESFNASWLTGCNAIYKGKDIVIVGNHNFAGFRRLKKINVRKMLGRKIEIIHSEPTGAGFVWVG